MRQPLVSIITPSYGHARYIRQTIESVLAQDYPLVEHIVVDGGSTDGTVEILREYGERYPDRFRWVSEPDRGQSHAFNKGLAMARGEFIGWQNSDDYYYPNVFAAPIGYLALHPDIVAVFSECDHVDEHGTLLKRLRCRPFRYPALLETYCLVNQSTFMRRDALLRCGGLAEDLHYAMDYDVFLRLGLLGLIDYVPGVVGVWRVLASAKTQAGLAARVGEQVACIERVLAHPLLPAAYRPRAEISLRKKRATAAAVALEQGHVSDARVFIEALIASDKRERALHCLSATLLDRSRLNAGTPLERLVAPALLVLEEHGQLQFTAGRRIVAMHALFRAVDARRTHRYRTALAALLQALMCDRWWLSTRAGARLLLHLLLGETRASRIGARVRQQRHIA